jgi:hypothetical protein
MQEPASMKAIICFECIQFFYIALFDFGKFAWLGKEVWIDVSRAHLPACLQI